MVLFAPIELDNSNDEFLISDNDVIVTMPKSLMDKGGNKTVVMNGNDNFTAISAGSIEEKNRKHSNC